MGLAEINTEYEQYVSYSRFHGHLKETDVFQNRHPAARPKNSNAPKPNVSKNHTNQIQPAGQSHSGQIQYTDPARNISQEQQCQLGQTALGFVPRYMGPNSVGETCDQETA